MLICSATSSWSSSTWATKRSRSAISPIERAGQGQQQVAQRDRANEVLVALDDVDVVDALVLGGLGADVVDDRSHRHVLGDGGDLRGHDAAGGLVLVAEQGADDARLLDAHQAQQRLGLVVGEVADDVGGVVRVHLGEEV